VFLKVFGEAAQNQAPLSLAWLHLTPSSHAPCGRSLEGKSKHQLWLELCDIITKHPDDVKDLNVDAILRSGIRKFTDEVGRLWTSLADYYIRRGMFEKARDVYEEGLTSGAGGVRGRKGGGGEKKAGAWEQSWLAGSVWFVPSCLLHSVP
jgi:pentatricopeptide repeat protein